MSYPYGLQQPPAPSVGGGSSGLAAIAGRVVAHLRGGIVIPFIRDEKNDFANAAGFDLIRSNVRVILKTRPGQLRWRPRFGSRLHLLTHRNVDETLLETARIYAIEALGTWEPRVRVTKCTALKSERGLEITVLYNIVNVDAPGRVPLLVGLSETIIV